MTRYEQYQQMRPDWSCLGLEHGPAQSEYFCTPVGAEVIAWTGVDGIHYCFVPGFGETVFVVGPMNGIGDYVYPVANTFEDFLRLVLACGGEAAITEAYDWTQAIFDAFLAENQPTAEQAAVLEQLRDAFDLTPMEEPFAYIKAVQAAFDYSRIPYSEEYRELTGDYEGVPAEETASAAASCWKVSYAGGFWSNDGDAGDEVAVNKTFDWGEERWHIPSVYLFPEGLVIDFCMEAEPEPVRAFYAKWEPILENADYVNRELRQQIEAEHPLDFRMQAQVMVNGEALRADRGSGMFWIPAGCSSMAENRPETEAILAYYGLNPAHAWAFSRQSFRWKDICPEEIDTLQVKLERRPVEVPGAHFRTSGAGDRVSFLHPLTGAEHTLTVREYEAGEMDAKHFQNEDMEYPTHYAGMFYTIYPELPQKECSVQDCSEGDAARRKQSASAQGTVGASVGVIGMIRNDGDTAPMQHPDGTKAVPRVVCSALHFEPVTEVEWQLVFRKRTHEDLTVTVI